MWWVRMAKRLAYDEELQMFRAYLRRSVLTIRAEALHHGSVVWLATWYWSNNYVLMR